MTFEEKARAMLVERGMFPKQADEVVAMMKQDPANEAMSDRWRDNIEDYPIEMLAILLFSAKTNALEWIDKNCPKAWYRPMFEKDATPTEESQ